MKIGENICGTLPSEDPTAMENTSTEKRGLKRPGTSNENSARPSKISNCIDETDFKPVAKDEDRQETLMIDEQKEAASQKTSEYVESNSVELLSLSDDLLLIIMSNLKPTDLLSLTNCCERLQRVASDWSLWKIVDCRPFSMTPTQLKRCLEFLGERTESIATRGFISKKPLPCFSMKCLSHKLLTEVFARCPNLHTFIAEEHYIDAEEVKITSFPKSIERLSLNRSELINSPAECSYFQGIYPHLQNLKVLELSDCTWLVPHSMMAISKIPLLEELRLDGCYLMRDCIAYTSLSFNLGFPKLRILDLRRTGMSDSELACLDRCKTLTHLYLEYQRDESNAIVPVVTDTGLRSLLTSDKPHVVFNNAQFGIYNEDILVSAPMKNKVSLCKIHTLVARNFLTVTDLSLVELCFAHSLRYLDLTGTRITREGVNKFRAERPDVTLISKYDDHS